MKAHTRIQRYRARSPGHASAQLYRAPLSRTDSGIRALLRAPPEAQRKCAGCEDELQRAPNTSAHPVGDVSATVASGTAAGGQPLSPGLRHFFEPRFGQGLGPVQLHTDSAAAASANTLNARAYTFGRDIVFGVGQYAPETYAGRRLLAHELTHVVQQGAATAAPGVQRDDKDKPATPSLPKQGVKIVGKDADKIVTTLANCTGLGLKLDAEKMLSVTSKTEKKGAGISPTARAQVLGMIEKPPHGVLIDTGTDSPFVGQFSHDVPGYQRLDVGDVTALAGAGGEKGGATACDLMVHEISEAFFGRAIGLEGKTKGKDKAIYEQAHAEAAKIEAKVRADLGLVPRSGKFSMQFIGIESADSTLWLNATEYSKDKDKTKLTQLSVLRGALGPEKDGTRNVETITIIVTRVVKGEVTFGSRDEAIKTFNRYASDFGFEPLPLTEKKK